MQLPGMTTRNACAKWCAGQGDGVAAFFGPLRADPVVVACLTPKCVRIFGDDAAGAVAYGWYAIKLMPTGQRVAIATHELTHAELHRRVGLISFARTAVPMWFDEGLAVLISKERGRSKSPTRAELADVVAARTYAEWHAYVGRVGGGPAYRAALAAVRGIDRRIGRKRFRAFVSRLEEGRRLRRCRSRVRRSSGRVKGAGLIPLAGVGKEQRSVDEKKAPDR